MPHHSNCPCMTCSDGERSEEFRKEFIAEIWNNPNWEIESSEYSGDGYYDVIMTVRHDGEDYWTEAVSKDGEILDFGERPLRVSGQAEAIADYME